MNRMIVVLALTVGLSGCTLQEFSVSDEEGNSESQGNVQTEINSNTSVTLYWSPPVERVNGDPMVITDIGGYEIRYKKIEDDVYTNILIDDRSIDQYQITELEDADNYSFEVAVFDTDGIYSDFVLATSNN